MKRSLWLYGIFFLVFFCLFKPQCSFGAPIAEDDINQFINSPDFEKLFGTMSDDEKAALAQATMLESQKTEQLPPPTLEAKKTSVKTAPSFDISKLTDVRKLIERTCELIENVDLQFAGLPRVSSNNVLEKKWAQIKVDIPLTVATLKAVGKKNQLLEKLMSSEYNALKDQLNHLRMELEKNHKNLTTPDVGNTARPPEPIKQEKKLAKRTRNSVIELLHHELPPISLATKGLLEKYAPEVLKESKIKMPQPRSSRASSYDSYGDSGFDSDYASGYGIA